MLTRLRVSGFRNLVDADVRFGPFTCVVGPNGAGKTNLFDAIRFLSAMAGGTLSEAAATVCGAHGRAAHVGDLFHRAGDRSTDRMTLVADMVVPGQAVDDLGQGARASNTFLRYSVELAERGLRGQLARGALAVVKEELVHIVQRDAPHDLLFPHSARDWRRSAVRGRRAAQYFISTEGSGEYGVVLQHQDGGGGGPVRRRADGLPRTVLSAATAAVSPTALAARREMQSWQLLQLQPAAMRRPDRLSAPARLATDGSHLAATLRRLNSAAGRTGTMDQAPLQAISTGLAELVHDDHDLHVEVDHTRDLLALPAVRTLSDGALRLLALLVLAHDPQTHGMLCVDEPERGIDPARIAAVMDLLQGIAVDTRKPVGADNPLRQVIVSTHSPSMLQRAPEDSVLFVRADEAVDQNGSRCRRARFLCLSGTWRAEDSGHASRDDLAAYLDPAPPREDAGRARPKRVVDREDMKQLPLFPPEDDR